MPEPTEQPGQPVPPATAAPVPKKRKRARATQAERLAEIRQKYRLDDEVILNTVKNGRPLGKGPLMSPDAWGKFARLDNTPDLRYLDWVLYQAGGGDAAFRVSLSNWGDDATSRTPEDYFQEFDREVPNLRVDAEEVNKYVRKKLELVGGQEWPRIGQVLRNHAGEIFEATAAPAKPDKFAALVQLFKRLHIGEGKEDRIGGDRIAGELLSLKIKAWVKAPYNSSIKTKDRVHTLFIYGKLLRRMPREEAEQLWEAGVAKRKREFCFGDEDSKPKNQFGFWREWPGGGGHYENVHSTLQTFIKNIEVIERRNASLERRNAEAAEKNKTLLPGQQIPMREPIQIESDVGRVIYRNEKLVYQGHYPTLQSMESANEAVLNLPFHERVVNDVRFLGHRGKISNSETVYSDENVDVFVPLTLAASIRAGHPSWDISDPEQMKSVSRESSSNVTPWSRWHLGVDAYDYTAPLAAYAPFKKVAIMFHVKRWSPCRILLRTNMDELVDLAMPFSQRRFHVDAETEAISWFDLMERWRTVMGQADRVSLGRSLVKGLRAVQKMAFEYEPNHPLGGVVVDPVAYHRERIGKRRGLRLEWLHIRARQVADLLVE